ncbi:hypothetical protein C8Q73DRAFT_834065 [Cubamyces lactineus]|nr:hypothetical protein C8Q73DRAFT_834065 [Cubamyces lactineus]
MSALGVIKPSSPPLRKQIRSLSQAESPTITMLAASSTVPATTPAQQMGESDPFVLYARSLHDYTLRLWTESRRIAEEKARIKAAAVAASTAKSTADPARGKPTGQKKPADAPAKA